MLLFGIVPLGAAAQALGSATALCAWFSSLRKGWSGAPRSLQGATIAAIATIATLLFSTWLNPANPSKDYAHYFLGHLAWIALPFLGQRSLQEISKESRQRLFTFAAYVLIIWGLVVTSQSLWGWRLSGNEFVSSDLRPRGFYSHPLSLAYAVLWFWPAALHAALRPGRTRLGIATGIMVALMIYWTESRTVQGVAFLLLVWNLATLLKGRTRQIAAGLFIVGLVITFATENRISHKFVATFSKSGVDRHSDYADDRLAFWHAHSLMVKERPLIGHGIDLDRPYRTPYYEELGLGDFLKKYEAHNTYLQLIAEGGLIAFAFFGAWWVCACRRIRELADKAHGRIAWQTLLVMGMAAMTQNAFQDFETRTALTFAAIVLWLLPIKRPSALSSHDG